MARVVWKGNLTFGLVNIPIELYAATQEHILGFKLLHDKCHHPISNKRWCDYCQEEVAWNHTVKGLKLKNGSYFIISQEKLKELKPEKTDTITIEEFVDKDNVPIIYYDNHYYLLPKGKTDYAFFLFSRALEKFGKSAIGRFVMRDKEYVCLIEPLENILSLSTLNYTYEIKPIPKYDQLKVPKKISSKELELAQLLMNKLYNKKFDITRYKDTFAQKLLANIVATKKGKKIEKKPAEKKEVVPSVMVALKESLKEHETSKKAKRG